jgi:cytidylate kinase
MYRAVSLIVIEEGLDPADGPAVAAAVRRRNLHFDWTADPPRIMLEDRDVSDRIRDMDVSGIVSIVAARSEVREVLVALQREIAARHPRLVTEGRDQGSAVFPDAPVRFFLDADAGVRAERRIAQLNESGRAVDAAGVLHDIERRDTLDTSRRDGPLVRPRGAITIDTGPLSVDLVVDLMERTVRREIAGFADPDAADADIDADGDDAA